MYGPLLLIDILSPAFNKIDPDVETTYGAGDGLVPPAPVNWIALYLENVTPPSILLYKSIAVDAVVAVGFINMVKLYHPLIGTVYIPVVVFHALCVSELTWLNMKLALVLPVVLVFVHTSQATVSPLVIAWFPEVIRLTLKLPNERL